MSTHSLEELFIDKLKDIYDAEKRITRALPSMVKTASSEELSSAFEEHLQQTEGQIERLDRVFKNLGKTPGRKTCRGMMGILEEGQELMEEEGEDSVIDAGLIAGAQEVEHYEIAAYGTLRAWAELLGKREEARLLQETLREEEETDEKLTQLASSINPHAMQTESDEEEPVATSGRSGNGRSSGRRSR